MTNPEVRLRAFQAENNIYTKGPLSLVIQFTRLVRKRTFPLNPDDFQTSSKGQVAGLGGGNLKKILKEHGITQQLSAEGGRTSRGSMGLMIKYVDLLNEWNTEETVDFAVVEDFWAEQVREYFRNQPFILTADTSKKNTNTFWGLFGEDTKSKVREQLNADEHLKATEQAFIELGRQRNLLVHENFAEYDVNTTVGEIYEKYKLACEFVSFIAAVLDPAYLKSKNCL